MTEALTKYQAAMTLLADIVALQEQSNAHEKLPSIIRRSKKILAMKGEVRNPNLTAAQEAGRASNQAKTDALRDSLMPHIEKMRAEGITTLRAMAEELNRLEIKTAQDGQWTFGALGRILNR